MDTEEDDEIDIGCAGGIDVTATVSMMKLPGSVGYTITKEGGHSGMDIHKGWVMHMNRLLFDGFDNFGLQISRNKR
jgi:dipeptidase D